MTLWIADSASAASNVGQDARALCALQRPHAPCCCLCSWLVGVRRSESRQVGIETRRRVRCLRVGGMLGSLAPSAVEPADAAQTSLFDLRQALLGTHVHRRRQDGPRATWAKGKIAGPMGVLSQCIPRRGHGTSSRRTRRWLPAVALAALEPSSQSLQFRLHLGYIRRDEVDPVPGRDLRPRAGYRMCPLVAPKILSAHEGRRRQEGRPVAGPLFHVVDDQTVGDHRYVRVAPTDPATLAADLAPRVREYYINVAKAHSRIKAACSSLYAFRDSGLPDDAAIRAALAEEVDAAIPQAPSTEQPEQLDLRRSELAEILAAEVVRDIFGACIPASRIKHKEIPDQPTRGADVVALEHVDRDRPVLVLCEVKGSSEASSPPGVVSGMASKLKTLVGKRRALTQELEWVGEHADADHAKLVDEILVGHLLSRPQFSIMLNPVLLREAAVAADTDAGAFASAPESFRHPIRWVSIVVDADLLELAAEIYALARQVAA